MAELVLVTGGAGFIGSHLADELLERGHRVRVLMRKTSPTTNLTGLDAEPVEGLLLGAAVSGHDDADGDIEGKLHAGRPSWLRVCRDTRRTRRRERHRWHEFAGW